MNQPDIKSFPLFIASDHAGFELKTQLLEEKQFLWKDLGCFSKDRTDYPDWADKLCKSLKKPDNLQSHAIHSKKENPNSKSDFDSSDCNPKEGFLSESFGVLICGTGQGMAIRANRWKHIRASLCWNEEIAFLARSHNQANVLCLPGKFIDKNQAVKILDTFLKTSFHIETSYKRRIKKLSLMDRD